MEKGGFLLTLAACGFTVFLLGWQGVQGAAADWVPGFLAVFWSLLMMLRLMTLTEPSPVPRAAKQGLHQEGLAQKILLSLRKNQEETRQKALESAFGGSFLLYLLACFAFAGWQVFCALSPQDAPSLNSIETLMQSVDPSLSTASVRLFDWGRFFMLVLSFCMMAFVLRSFAANRGLARLALIVLCGYAAAGIIAFAGLPPSAGESIAAANFYGNGIGASAYLGHLAGDGAATLFDAVLMESGAGGLALLAFILFVPLGYIALAAQGHGTDWMVVTCGLLSGGAIIMALFLPLTPFLGAFMTLCAAAVFLAWGASEHKLTESRA